MTEQKKRQRRAAREERKIASDIGGRRVFMSGAGPDKGDVKSDLLRIEAKTTANSSFTFNSADWSDIVHSSDNSGKTPVFVIKLALKAFPFSVAILPRTFWLEMEPAGRAIPMFGEAARSIVINRDWAKSCPKDLAGHPFRQIQIDVQHCASALMARKKGDLVIIEYSRFIELLRTAGLDASS